MPATESVWSLVNAGIGATGEIRDVTANVDPVEFPATEFFWVRVLAGDGVVDGVRRP